MRWVCLTLVLGIAVACSGQPFTASTDSPSVSSAASGETSPAPSATTNDAASGGSSTGDEPRGGAASSDKPQLPTAGTTAALGGSPAAGEGGAAAGGESAAAVEPECPRNVVGDWELAYFPELRAATTQESHPFFKITKRGAPTTLDHIALRYYFTKESPLAETAACYWVTGDRCTLAKLEFGDVVPPAPNAARYLQVSFPGASDVTLGIDTFEVRVGFKTGSVPLLQTNDYSFDPDATDSSNAKPFPYKSWPRATLYLDGSLVWGAEPCASGSRPSRSTP